MERSEMIVVFKLILICCGAKTRSVKHTGWFWLTKLEYTHLSICKSICYAFKRIETITAQKHQVKDFRMY